MDGATRSPLPYVLIRACRCFLASVGAHLPSTDARSREFPGPHLGLNFLPPSCHALCSLATNPGQPGGP